MSVFTIAASQVADHALRCRVRHLTDRALLWSRAADVDSLFDDFDYTLFITSIDRERQLLSTIDMLNRGDITVGDAARRIEIAEDALAALAI